MSGEIMMPRTIKFAVFPAPKFPVFAIQDKYDNVKHFFGATLMQYFSQYFRANYEFLIPPDRAIGEKLPDGNWSGMMGMVKRSEADIAMFPITLTEERSQAVNFSYVFHQSALTFMTDKPTPLPKNMALIYPFSLEIWIILLLSMITVAFVLYILMKRKLVYHKVLFSMLGSLMTQGCDLKINKATLKIATLTWFLGVFIITNSYRGILLSFLTIPTMTGIRDKSDLLKAITANSVKCYKYTGGYVTKNFIESEDDSLKAIGKCLNQTENVSGNMEEDFFESPFKKVFMGGKDFLLRYERNYFISSDSFISESYALPISKSFCCPKRLNTMLLRYVAAGILKKIQDSQTFFLQRLIKPLKSSQSEISNQICFDDISAAFYILIFGLVLSFLIFIAEIISVKYSAYI